MADRLLAYIGTYTRGDEAAIYRGQIDAATGALTVTGKTACDDNPSYLSLHPSGRYLYAINEVTSFGGAGAVTAFAIDPDSGELTFLNQQPTGGAGPCHNTVDASGRWVLCANYGGGSICIHPVQADGSLGEMTDFHQHRGSSVDPARQEGPHAHSINMDPGNRFAFCADLGLDKVLVYELDHDSGELQPAGAGAVAAGAGPRHFAFHPNRRFAYAINEMGNTITAFAYGESAGSLDPVQTLTTLPAGFAATSHTADVHLTPDGRFLYGSNRGHDSIAIFTADAGSGRLAPLGHQPVPSTPRNFALDPSGSFLYAGGQNVNEIPVYRIDGKSGRLAPTGHRASAPTPVCIKILKVS